MPPVNFGCLENHVCSQRNQSGWIKEWSQPQEPLTLSILCQVFAASANLSIFINQVSPDWWTGCFSRWTKWFVSGLRNARHGVLYQWWPALSPHTLHSRQAVCQVSAGIQEAAFIKTIPTPYSFKMWENICIFQCWLWCLLLSLLYAWSSVTYCSTQSIIVETTAERERR